MFLVISNRMENYKSENDLWTHAKSLEEKRNEIDLKVELQALRELFFDYLPLGEKTDYIENYFNRLEEAIDNKEHVERETFPDDDDGDESDQGGDAATGTGPPSKRKRDYKYFSATIFKEQASRHPPLASEKDVDRSRLYEIQDGDAQDQFEATQPLEFVSEHSGGCGTGDGDVESSN